MITYGKNQLNCKSDNMIDSNTKIRAIADNEKFIWLATDEGAYRINKKSNETIHLTKTNSSLPSNQVTSICCDKDDNVWIGTTNGILRYDNYAYILMNSENTDLPDNHVTAMVVDKNNDLWIGTYTGGIMKVHNFRYKVYNHLNSAMITDDVFSLSSDDLGNVWVGLRENGLIRINGNNWDIYNKSSELGGINVSFVTSIDGGNYYIGTYNKGVFVFDGKEFVKSEIYNVSSSTLRFAYKIADNRWIVGNDAGAEVVDSFSNNSNIIGNFYSLLSCGYFKNNNGLLAWIKKEN